MFLRIGVKFGPIVRTTAEAVFIQVLGGEFDGEIVAIEREDLLPFAMQDVWAFEAMVGRNVRV